MSRIVMLRKALIGLLIASFAAVLAFFGAKQDAHAQILPAQNQVIFGPYPAGWVVSTSSSATAKLGATTTPYFANFFFGNATGTELALLGYLRDSSGIPSYNPTGRTIELSNGLVVFDGPNRQLLTSSGGVSIDFENLSFATAGQGNKALFQTGSLTSDHTFTFPDEDGTLALGTGTAGNCAQWSTGNTLTDSGSPCGSGGGDTNWQVVNGTLVPTTTIPVFVGTTTKPYYYVNGDLFGAATSTNDFADISVSNLSTGNCATSEFDAQNANTSLTNFFSAFGHTGSGFTGSGCANTPYTDFGMNSTYVLNGDGNINFALSTSTGSQSFRWYGGGYAATNRLMTLTKAGFLGFGINNPDAPITISTAGTTTNIVAPQAGTLIHLASSGAQNARITGDVYTNGTSQGFVFQGRKSRGGVGSPTAVNADDTLAVLGGVGYGTTGFPSISAGAYVVRAEASGTDTSQPTYLAMLTTPTGTITPLERMRITSTGNTGIGSTSPYAKLSVHLPATVTNTTAFAIGSSTAAATSTLFSVNNIGSTTLRQVPSSILYTNSNSTIVGTPFTTNGFVLALANGIPTWVATSSILNAGGSDTQVQYNNNGALAGDAGMTYSASADRLTVTYASTTGLSTSGSAYFATAGGSVGIASTTPGSTLAIGSTAGINLVPGASTTATSTFQGNIDTYGTLSFQNNSQTNYFKQHRLGFLDLVRDGADYTLMRIRAPLNDSNEATLSLVVDRDTPSAGINEEFIDFYNENYSDSRQWGMRQAYSGTGQPKPGVFGFWNTAGGKDVGNQFILMPNGTSAFARATSTVDTGAMLYVASSTASALFTADATPGTERFTILSGGSVGISSSTPWASLALNPIAGQASNAFAVGSSTATRFLITNNGSVGIGTTTPWVINGLSASSTITSFESREATSSTTNIDFENSNQSVVYLGSSAVTITFSNTTPGIAKRITLCNPVSSTAGAVTWPDGGTLLWDGGTVPTQITTANKCSVYSFVVTTATSTTKVFGVKTGGTTGF